jgi:hypothetical protein
MEVFDPTLGEVYIKPLPYEGQVYMQEHIFAQHKVLTLEISIFNL